MYALYVDVCRSFTNAEKSNHTQHSYVCVCIYICIYIHIHMYVCKQADYAPLKFKVFIVLSHAVLRF